VDRRLDRTYDLESDFAREGKNRIEGASSQSRIADYAAFFRPCPFPTSNCGFTNATISAAGAAISITVGSTSRSEMKLVSMTIRFRRVGQIAGSGAADVGANRL